MADRSRELNGKSQVISIEVNGELHEVTVRPRHTLVEVLREKIGLTGTKDGCEQGVCGACTVLLEGRPALSCLTLSFASRAALANLFRGQTARQSSQPKMRLPIASR